MNLLLIPKVGINAYISVDIGAYTYVYKRYTISIQASITCVDLSGKPYFQLKKIGQLIWVCDTHFPKLSF